MKKRSILYILLTACIFILLIILFLFSLKTNSVKYTNKDVTINNVKVSYPQINKVSDKEISKYLSSINLAKYNKVDYDINFIDNYTSILFKLYKNDKIDEYHSLLFNKDNKLANINSVIANPTIIKDKISLYLYNNGLYLTSDELNKANYSYLLKNNELLIYLTNYNDKNEITFIKLNYNELKNNLKIKCTFDEKYQMMSTTTKNMEPLKTIAFTFDDGPSVYTESLLDILDKYHAKATFFEVGYMINARKEVTLDVYNRGFEIGNHTIDHSKLTKLSADKVLEKIKNNNDLFHSITNSDMKLVRPPYGSVNPLVRQTINEPFITWSVDSEDWKSKNTDTIVTLVESTVQDGDIVLFHDLYPTTIEAIKILIPYLYEHNYHIVTVSELFTIKNKPLELGQIYRDAR
jgi:peptidoglycan/xylan/chitin deacetylase (PgdA/CDA1 family)